MITLNRLSTLAPIHKDDSDKYIKFEIDYWLHENGVSTFTDSSLKMRECVASDYDEFFFEKSTLTREIFLKQNAWCLDKPEDL